MADVKPSELAQITALGAADTDVIIISRAGVDTFSMLVSELKALLNSSGGFQKVGTNVYLVTISDNVGIGTITPTHKLSIFTDTDDIFLIGNTASPEIFKVYKTGSNVYLEASYKELIFNGVNIFTGNTQITGSLQLIDGTEAAGYILTSDATGNASWQASSTVTESYLDSLNDYADDAAAATGGVAIGKYYFNSVTGQLQKRLT